MSLLRKLVLSLCVCLMVAACGFTPVYSTQNKKLTTNELAAIRVEPIRSREGAILVNKLEQMLTQGDYSQPQKYKLTITLSRDRTAIAIERDRTISRFRLVLTAKYTLKDTSTGKVIDSGLLKREGGYDKVESDYATYVSEEDAINRIARELAEDFRIHLTSALLQKKAASGS